MLEESLLKYWRGFDLRENPDHITDYDRACQVNEYVGTIAVDSGYGLVLGGEPFQTAWLQFPETIMVCWDHAENETAVVEALSNLPSGNWEDTEVEIQFSGGKLILFDSAFDENEIDESLEIEVPKGKYKVQTFHYVPNKQTSMILHRFNQR